MRKAVIAAVGLVLLGGLAWYFFSRDSDDESSQPSESPRADTTRRERSTPVDNAPFAEPGKEPPVVGETTEGITIDGDVSDERGAQVMARVALSRVNDGAGVVMAMGTPRMAPTDKEGRFAFAGLRAGTYRLVAVEAAEETRAGSTPLHAGAEVRPSSPVEVEISDRQGATVHLVLKRGLPLAGMVKDNHGAALTGATVYVVIADIAPRDSGPGPGEETRLVLSTGEGGRFATNVRDGEYLVTAAASNGTLTQRKPLRVRAGDTSIELTVEPAPKVMGRVIHSDGSPVTAYWLSLKRGGTFMHPVQSPDGTFQVDAIHGNAAAVEDDGALVVSVKVEGLAPMEKSVFFDGSSEVHVPDFVVGNLQKLVVTVVDRANSQPIAGATVQVQDATPDVFRKTMSLTQPVMTDSSGRVEKEVSGQGGTLRVSHPQYAIALVPVPPGLTEATVQLDGGGNISGHVTDSAGRPVVDALVVATAGDFSRASPVDAQGRYSIPHLAPAIYVVAVEPHQAFRSGALSDRPDIIGQIHRPGEQTRSIELSGAEAVADFVVNDDIH
jgi:uncharacterized GH25 family protein